MNNPFEVNAFYIGIWYFTRVRRALVTILGQGLIFLIWAWCGVFRTAMPFAGRAVLGLTLTFLFFFSVCYTLTRPVPEDSPWK